MSNPIAADLILDLHCGLGEGPVWDAARHRLLFVDIMAGRVHAFDPATGDDRHYDVGAPAGAVACTARGDWIVAAGVGFVRLDPDTSRITPIVEVSPGRNDLRMNDGYVDSHGRFWAGTMRRDLGPDGGALYRLDPDGSVHTMLAPVSISNGIDWSLDDRLMYFIDTPTGRVDIFDFDAARGTIAGRRPFVQIPTSNGSPDGLVVDADGGIWVALWGGGAVHRYRPDGTLDRIIQVPVKHVTKCAFAGPTLEDLYITTSEMYLDADQRRAHPHAGGLFRAKPGFQGRPPNLFKG